jgi:hypothetical protein
MFYEHVTPMGFGLHWIGYCYYNFTPYGVKASRENAGVIVVLTIK